MSPSQSASFPQTGLSETLNRRVSLYSVVAVAAGVSVLALSQPAEGEVVITKKTIPILISREGQDLVPISLTNNGINDFSFSLYSFAYHSAHRTLRILPLEGGAAVAHTSAGFEASALALARGAKIGPSAHFSSGKAAFIEGSHANFGYTTSGKSFYTKSFAGKWGGNQKNRYLGVRFLINGETHYGWVRLTVTTASRAPMSATITAYAYETIPNKRIQAGIPDSTIAAETKADNQVQQPLRASLGMLALGVDGLPLLRRDESRF